METYRVLGFAKFLIIARPSDDTIRWYDDPMVPKEEETEVFGMETVSHWYAQISRWREGSCSLFKISLMTRWAPVCHNMKETKRTALEALAAVRTVWRTLWELPVTRTPSHSGLPTCSPTNNEQTNKRKNKWVNKRMSKQTNKQTNEWANKRMSEQTNEQTNEWANKRMSE
jgi:hypothetical protein